MTPLPSVTRFVSDTAVRIYRIPCQVFESLSARVHLLLGAGRPTLIDSGSGLGQSAAQILAGIDAVREEFGEPVRAEDIGRIIVSHGHIDHTGGLPDLLARMPAEVLVHPLDRGAITHYDEYLAIGTRGLKRFLQQAGVPVDRRTELLKYSPARGRKLLGVSVSGTIEDGDQFDGLRFVHTPGHSPGHLCVVVGNLILTGDHLLAHTLPHQWPESITAYTGLGHYLESLDKLRAIPGIEAALPAHEQVIHNFYHRIGTVRATHERKLARLLGVIREANRPLTLHEIASQTYAEVRGFRAVLAFADVGSRVEYLQQRNELAVANWEEIERDAEAPYRYILAG